MVTGVVASRGTTMETENEPNKQAKYLEIIDSIRSDLRAGRYRPGDRLPSESELVHKFKVSRMTVVKAVLQMQQEGLVERRAGSGTYAAHRSAREGRVFGLLIPDLGQTEIFEPICRGMMRSPSASSHSLSWGHALSPSKQKEEEAEQLCHRYIEQAVAGVFFAPLEFSAVGQEVSRRILQELSKAQIPVVLLDRDFTGYPRRSAYDLVSLNHRHAAYIVTEHLINQGGSRIAFFAREHSAETVEHRIVGYREALYAHDLDISKSLVLRGDPADETFVEASLSMNRIESIMCANDLTAAKLMQTLTNLGIRIPTDIRIAGVDDVKYASLLPIPLTTLHQPCHDIGAASMAAMLDRVSNPHLPPRSILLNGHLVVRRSCGSAVEKS